MQFVQIWVTATPQVTNRLLNYRNTFCSTYVMLLNVTSSFVYQVFQLNLSLVMHSGNM